MESVRVWIIAAILVLCLVLHCTQSYQENDVLYASEFHSYKLKPDDEYIKVNVSVNQRTAVRDVDSRFVSITLDSSLVDHHWDHLDFQSVRLHTLAKALSPAYLRFGGTAADFLIFRQNSSSLVTHTHSANCWLPEDCIGGVMTKNFTNFYMSEKDFDNINQLAAVADWRMVFDLNVLLRDSQNHWNSSNARELLRYAVKKKYDKNMDLELGNEPNAFHHELHKSITATQLAADFKLLHAVLKESSEFSGKFPQSIIIGPSTTGAKNKTLNYLLQFLRAVSKAIDVISVHHYYINGRTARLEDMMSRDVLDSLAEQLSKLQHTVAAAGRTDMPVWLGETSSCWGGGAPGLSDRYVAGFMWLDKLGVAAKMGINVVARQSFFHGHYALLDDYMYPRPDFWLTWLYKRLVGERVLDVKVTDNKDVRLYAHCTAANRLSSRNGAVTVYGLNVGDRPASLRFDAQLSKYDKHVYWLLPAHHNDLTSKLVSVSGKILRLVTDSVLPQVDPVVVAGGHQVTVPPQSFGFIVVPGAQAAACLS